MSDRNVASRYAKSILDLAVETNVLESVYQNMVDLISTCKSSSALQGLLRNPITPLDKKLSILKALFETQFNKLTIGFFEIMIRKERSEIILPAAVEFINQYNSRNKIVIAEITTAIQISPELEAQLLEKVRQLTEGEIQVHKIVDPEIIGGFILRVEDKQIDTSFRTKLAGLRKELVDTSFSSQI